MTVDELARATDLPVRTIREYQTMRLLPPPTKQGRVGLYGVAHRERLRLIARLQARGYSLAAIRDLVAGFEAGANLPALLGLDFGPAALDETPQRLTRSQLLARLPALADAATLERALSVGLVHQDGARHFLVRSPALVALISDAARLSVEPSTMFDLVGAMRSGLDDLAGVIVAQFVERIWEPRAVSDGVDSAQALLQRGRLLLLQAVVSLLADRLGAALLLAAETAPHGEQLRAAVERVSVGAIVDGQGNLSVRRTS